MSLNKICFCGNVQFSTQHHHILAIYTIAIKTSPRNEHIHNEKLLELNAVIHTLHMFQHNNVHMVY